MYDDDDATRTLALKGGEEVTYSFEEVQANYRARVERSKKTFIRDTTGEGFDVVRYSELPLHKDHHYKITETLYDNSVEFTTWAYCDDCKTEFWVVSVGITG